MPELISHIKGSGKKSQFRYYSYFPVVESETEVELLPSDHALYYPLRLGKHNEVLNGEVNFYTRVFIENYRRGNLIPETKYEIARESVSRNKVLFVNITDNCYGHSFQKLLNLYFLYHKYSGEFDLCVITQKNIAHFVPALINMVVLSVGYNEAQKCYDLSPIVDKVKQKYQDWDFAALDTYLPLPPKQDLRVFFPLIKAESEKRSLVFYYRSDFFRSWQHARQVKNIDSFFRIIGRFFDDSVQLIVVGDKDDKKFCNPRILDKRTGTFGAEVDYAYNAIFHGALITIGLIGSNMLLPSLLSGRTIHLVPSTKVTIVGEEIINSPGTAIQQSLESVYLYSNSATLDDYSPERLAYETVMLFLTSLAKEYKHEAFALCREGKVIGQKVYIRQRHPYFDLEGAYAFKAAAEEKKYKPAWRRYHLQRLLKRFGFRG